jgi:hypothetical protein
MKIIARRKVEDCFDGSAVFNYQVSTPWTADSVRCLAALGELQYFADFPRPLFRLRTRGGVFVSGIEGADTCRVILPRTNRDAVQQELENAMTKDV